MQSYIRPVVTRQTLLAIMQVATAPAIFVDVSPRNIMGIVVLGAVMVWFWLGDGLMIFSTTMYQAQQPAAQNMMDDIHKKVSTGAVEQYNITRSGLINA
jgi:hypothetical protein